MPTIIFVQHDGSEQHVSAELGQSVMQAAVHNQIPGIFGDCGGNCSCGTCHAYIDKVWTDRIPAAQSYEQDMLTYTSELSTESRLTCQIIVTPELDGLLVRLPAAQY